MACAYGLRAARVKEPGELAEALGGALLGERPSLLDVCTDVWETPIAAHRRALAQDLPGGYGT